MFKEINEMIAAGQTLTIVVNKTSTNMTVSFYPQDNGVKDDAKNKIMPLSFTGTPEELDNGVMEAILNPIKKASGLLSNMGEFEESQAKAEQNSKAVKEKADNINRIIKAAEKLEENNKLNEAILEYRKVLEFEPKHPRALKKIGDISAKTSQLSMFNEEEEL